ncbi:hypothetical protein PSHT_09148 [Puccinia striiformis]|uniref:Uncharacterized protein n=1 Tax=Puccinia striiformis TaxID=27350 RepID=A0A2S4VIK8_9BASI|nr:hypothetical protein PSHT_09148 [Puccinia striiformis]
MHFTKVTLLVFLAGFCEFTTACKPGEDNACAHPAGFYENLFVSDTDPCTLSEQTRYCCPGGKLPGLTYIPFDYRGARSTTWTMRNRLVATWHHNRTLSIFLSPCFTCKSFLNWQPVNVQIPELK